MEYFERDRYYLTIDDCIKRTEEEKRKDRIFVNRFMEKFHIINDDETESELIVLPTEEFYYLIATVISEYESYLKLYPTLRPS